MSKKASIGEEELRRILSKVGVKPTTMFHIEEGRRQVRRDDTFFNALEHLSALFGIFSCRPDILALCGFQEQGVLQRAEKFLDAIAANSESTS